MIALPPEAELLALAVRPHRDAETQARLCALAGAVDPSRVAFMAWDHGVGPLLRQSLREAGAALPSEAEAALRHTAQSGTAASLVLARELSRLVGRLEAEGIPVIAYKGPTLALRAYGDLALRLFVDLDLLLPRRDVRRATALLRADGYRFHAPEGIAPPTEDDVEIVLRHEYHLALRRDRPEAMVELHWRFASRKVHAPFDLDGVWARRQSLDVAGRAVPTLAPEDLVLVLAVHGMKHYWASLEQIASFAGVIARTPDLDWDAVTREARRIGALRTLHMGLRLAHDLLDLPLPEPVRTSVLADRAVLALRADVLPLLFPAPDAPPPPAPDTLAGLRYLMRMRERRRDRVRMAFANVFSPGEGDTRWLRLPRPLYGLYPLLRPVRLALARLGSRP